MKISCPSCDNNKSFLIPLWVRCTFRFNKDGTISILHVRQLESLEDKIVDQGKTSFAITCKECGNDAEVVLNEYEDLETQKRQSLALGGL